MKKIVIILSVLILLVSVISPSFAVYEPSTRPNNIFGIHILFPHELPKAASLVNSNGGDWGYVTIPIQAGDRDLEKWQRFMSDCHKLHLIPIIRIATEAYYANTSVWRKPNYTDVLDFANFLNSLNWPVQNRYVMLFNEVNRYDEWGGDPPSPEEYSEIVLYATEAFKSLSPHFFVIAGGLDNASPNDGSKYLDNFVYLRRMGNHNPDVFKKNRWLCITLIPKPKLCRGSFASKERRNLNL